MATETTPTVNATVRTETGKGVARRLRAEGLIPAVCYGRGLDNISLSIDPEEFEKVTSRPQELNTVFSIALDSGDTVDNVMLRDYQVDPVRRMLTHADLVVVKTDEPLKVRVPIRTTGKAAGVAMGGRLRFIHPYVEVWALPLHIPDAITVDVTDLTPEGAIMAGELDYPEGVEPAYKVDHALVRIQMPRAKLEPVTPVGATAVVAGEEAEGEEAEGEEGEEGEGEE